MAELQLAALLCSRLCHDLVGPVGALNNGLEILAEEQDEDMRAQATALLGDSAVEASRRLQFFRLAFGAGGGGRRPQLAVEEARKAAHGLFNKGRISVDWPPVTDGRTLEKSAIKLLLNLILLGAGALPRGGLLSVCAPGDDPLRYVVTALGPGARVEPELRAALGRTLDAGLLDTHTVIAYYAGALAADIGCQIAVQSAAEGEVVLRMEPAQA